MEHSSHDTALLVASLKAATLEPRKVGNATFMVLPNDYELKEVTAAVEKANPTPTRKTGTVQLGNVPSLLQYLADQAKPEGAYVYADIDARSITAVFNDQRAADTPGWRDHRAVFKAELTPEFSMWLSKNKQPFTQSDFAEFVEDNLADLNGDDATLLLNVATTIQAKSGINFASARRLQDGQTQLTYNETIDATAGANAELKIPQKFQLGLRIFKNGEGYALSARLKFRLSGGAVKFWFELERPERAMEDAFNGYVEEIRAHESAYTVLIGKAS
ncbi:MAG: hypothetical protein JWR74_1176 [Polaromonas sp.]|nr:hypothetical protein [Polaromonas sp.]